MIAIKPFKHLLLPVALLLLGSVSAGEISKAIHKDSAAIQAAEKAGDKARAAGHLKAALTSYVAAIQGTPFGSEPDQRLREKVIALTRSMKPRPGVSEEVRRRVARAKVFLKRAKDRKGYGLVIREYEEALNVAPWWAVGYYNLGLVQEKTKDYAGAMRSLKLYLLVVPNAADAAQVKEKIYGLEAEQELAGPKKSVKGKTGIEWVTIPGGTFMMGSGKGNEKPVHEVTVPTFQMAKTEVTVAQYKACVEAGACTAPDTKKYCNWGKSERDDHPVNCVDWSNARAFAIWVGGRLPSEAEWEYAARSGGKDRKYPWGDEKATCERVAIGTLFGGGGCGRDSTWPVCSKPKGNTEQGLCDMAGNVAEWVQDFYHRRYKDAPTDGSAWESPKGKYRVFRGGSWHYGQRVRVASRFEGYPTQFAFILGFRPVRSP